MSVRSATWVICDRCGLRCDAPANTRNDTKSARREARSRGWQVRRHGGRDICPWCWEENPRD